MFRRTSGPEFNCMPDDEQEKSQFAPGDERARGSQLETRAGRHSGVHTVARVHPSVIMTAPARVVPPTDKSAAVSARMMSSVRRCASQVRVRAAPRVTSRPLPSPTRLTRPVASLPSQMATYGACVQAHMPDVTKGACEKELDALAACVFAAKER